MAKQKRKKKRLKRKSKKRLIKTLLIIVVLLLTAAGIYVYSGVPNISAYEYRKHTSSVIYTSDGYKIGEIASKNATYITREEIPDIVVNALVSIEDKRFFKHHGIDVFGIVRAVFNNIKEGEIVEGASTLTQQVAKILFFTSEQSYLRKLREAICALKLERKYTKDEILTIYLNEIYFGGGANGLYDASMTYFSIPPCELDIAQAAMLAGIIQAPSAYCPLDSQGYVYACMRKDKVVALMLENGYITQNEADAATEEQVVINSANKSEGFDFGEGKNGYRAYLNKVYEEALKCIAAYYQNELGYKVKDSYEQAESLLYSQNLTVNATLNYEMQENMLEAIEYRIEENAPNVSCACVCMSASSGNILCYYGADSDTYIDMADTARQCGSTIKPLYMLYLIENGIADVNSVVLDAPIEINGYSPNNYGDIYMGYVTLREALTNSLNAACLRLYMMGRQNELSSFISKLGITTLSKEDSGYSVALGGLYNGIKPTDMAVAYSSIANAGNIREPVYITSIIDESGKVIFKEYSEAKKVFSTETANKMKSCLESVVNRGTGMSAQNGYELFGKTGTTDDNRDVWFVGGCGDVIGVLWAGNVDALLVDGLTTSWPMHAFSDFTSQSISEGVYAFLAAPSDYSEEVETITVLKPEINIKSDITDNDVCDILIRLSDEAAFSSRRVVKVVVDSSSGLLFSEKCNEKNKCEKYYLIDSAPKEYCKKNHYLDNIEDFFNKIK